MNILFLSIGEFSNIEAGSVHIDLVRQLVEDGHNLYVVCKNERRYGMETSFNEEFGIHILRVKTGNLKRTNLIEKGFSTIMLERQFLNAIKKYLSGVRFDAVLFHTPSITFTNVIRYIKKRDNAVSYLLLKDIFPQNAVDMGIFYDNYKFTHIDSIYKYIMYCYFRRKEKKMYDVADRIGCMSYANCQYLKYHNEEISWENIELSPNSIRIRNTQIPLEDKRKILIDYKLPVDKLIFVYGGNIGRPQGIDFIINCLRECIDLKDVFFLIVGSGTEFHKLKFFYDKEKPANCKVISGLPKKEYERLVSACHVGLVFLDYAFTIPNYPSRILSYMQASMPILCVTDKNTDVGKDIVKGNCGWSCMSNDTKAFRKQVMQIVKEDILTKGQASFQYLLDHFDVRNQACNLENSLFDLIEKQKRTSSEHRLNV